MIVPARYGAEPRDEVFNSIGSLFMRLNPVSAPVVLFGNLQPRSLSYEVRIVMAAKKESRCWPGYEPVPGKKQHSEGSCRPKTESKTSAPEKNFRAKRKEQLDEWQKEHPGARRSAAQHLSAPGKETKKAAGKKTASKRAATGKRRTAAKKAAARKGA